MRGPSSNQGEGPIRAGTPAKTAAKGPVESGSADAAPTSPDPEDTVTRGTQLYRERPTVTIALPSGWARTGLAGIEAAVLGWAVPALMFAVAFLLVSSNPWYQDASVSQATRMGATFWVSSFGVPVNLGGVSTSITPLLWTLSQIAIFRALLLSGRNFDSAALWVAAPFYLATVMLISAASGVDVPVWHALPGALVVAVLAILWAFARQASVFPNWVTDMRWIWEAAWLGLRWLGATALIGLAGFVFALVNAWGSVVMATQSFGGGLGSEVGITALQFMYLPVGLAWVVAWLSGAGFIFVGGELVTPTSGSTVEADFLPVLAAVPATSPGKVVMWILVALGLLLGALYSVRAARTSIVGAARSVGVALTVYGAGLFAWMSLSRGHLGTGLLQDLGPTPQAWLAVTGLVAGVAALSSLALHPGTRRWLVQTLSSSQNEEDTSQGSVEDTPPSQDGEDDTTQR